MEERGASWQLKLRVAILFVFLLVPVLMIVPLSFSGENTLRFPPSSWGIRWYQELWATSACGVPFERACSSGSSSPR